MVMFILIHCDDWNRWTNMNNLFTIVLDYIEPFHYLQSGTILNRRRFEIDCGRLQSFDSFKV